MSRLLVAVLGLATFGFVASPSIAAEKPAQKAAPAAGPSEGDTAEAQLNNFAMATADEAHGKEAHDATGHKEPDFLEFKPSLMVTTIIIFTLLVLVLWKYAWGPLSHALAERERQQEETVRQAEHARSESARLLEEHRRQMESAAEQVRQLLEDARRQADANANTIVAKAQAEAEAGRQRAEREIGTARDQALVEIWTRTADAAVSVAGKVLGKEMNHDDHRRLIEAATAALPAAPVGANGHGALHS